MRVRALVIVGLLALLLPQPALAANPPPPNPLSARSIDGSGNNKVHPTWGKAGTPYLRVARPAYPDGIGSVMDGPNVRYVSNRVFNDIGQNIFSENGLSQWVWSWGQFIDHDIGLRNETPAEDISIPTDASDPLEDFTNDFGAIGMARTPAAPHTGTSRFNPRQQINTDSSYIDGSQVYGSTNGRLDWLRVGPVDGNPTNNSALLLLPGGYLPKAGARGDVGTAPAMDLMGPLTGHPENAVVAGDVRANENTVLTSIQTLFAREHNRIVGLLPVFLPEELKFQIARRIVGAEIQYVTYNEFLPTIGINLPIYRGYKLTINATLSNEFATVGFRAHSMVHGEFDVPIAPGSLSDDALEQLAIQGIVFSQAENEDGGDPPLVVPLSSAFGNPDLLQTLGFAPIFGSLAESQYNNDEQIDNALRSVLFEVPGPDTTDPTVCGAPVVDPTCFTGVVDLGAIDVERARDHGIPLYNALRRAYGLRPVTSFEQLTGEDTSAFPTDDELLEPGNEINSPASLDFIELTDINGNPQDFGTPDGVIHGVRRTTLAARLKAIYGDVNNVDAFVGMVSEPHLAGTDFGALQRAIWTKQFAALRDGDRFFYRNDVVLPFLQKAFGLTYKHTLAQIIAANTDAVTAPNVFKVAN